MRWKDLPVSRQAVELWWRKRRLICGKGLCPQKTFTQVCAAVRPRARVTERLRERVAQAIASGNRAVSEVAGEYRVSWPTAHKAVVAAAARWLPEPEPTSRLGIDETRFRSVRWILDQADRLRLSQHDQLPASYPEPHCGHPTAQISSMNGTNP